MANIATKIATTLQPVAPIDWGEMRALHVKGLSLTDLSKRFGISYSTVKSRAHREKWDATVAKANDAIVQSATRDLTASANHWIGRIDKLMHAGLDNVERKGIDNIGLRELDLALSCAEKANRIARSNYGLDKQAANATTNVQVNVMTAAASAKLVGGATIDVDATALPESGDATGQVDNQGQGAS
jgi:hypothetical protein